MSICDQVQPDLMDSSPARFSNSLLCLRSTTLSKVEGLISIRCAYHLNSQGERGSKGIPRTETIWMATATKTVIARKADFIGV